MTKTELIAAIAERTNSPKTQAESMLNETLAAIQEKLVEGEKVTLTGFGTFEVRERKDRAGVNPGTGERITIKGGPYAAFKVGSVLKRAISPDSADKKSTKKKTTSRKKTKKK